MIQWGYSTNIWIIAQLTDAKTLFIEYFGTHFIWIIEFSLYICSPYRVLYYNCRQWNCQKSVYFRVQERWRGAHWTLEREKMIKYVQSLSRHKTLINFRSTRYPTNERNTSVFKNKTCSIRCGCYLHSPYTHIHSHTHSPAVLSLGTNCCEMTV